MAHNSYEDRLIILQSNESNNNHSTQVSRVALELGLGCRCHKYFLWLLIYHKEFG